MGLSVKDTAFEKVLFLEYPSINNEKRLVLFPIPICRFNDSPGFNQPFLPVHIEDFLHKPLSKTCEKAVKKDKQTFPVFSSLAIMKFISIHVFCPLGKMESI